MADTMETSTFRAVPPPSLSPCVTDKDNAESSRWSCVAPLWSISVTGELASRSSTGEGRRLAQREEEKNKNAKNKKQNHNTWTDSS